MMTASQIQSALIALLTDSPLVVALRGEVYRHGLRPRDSRSEDLTLAITALSAGQRQRAKARLSLYIPDLPRGASATSDPDLRRAATLEQLATDWALSLTTDRTDSLRIRLAEGVRTLHLDDECQCLVALTLDIETLNDQY